MDADIRWKQRFTNFNKAFLELTAAVDRKTYDKLSQAGLIQMFELTFELAWKTLKDKLEYEGLKANSPRETLKISFKNGYIQKGELWIEALEKHNSFLLTYDEAKSDEARDLIRQRYFPLLKNLCDSLNLELTSISIEN